MATDDDSGFLSRWSRRKALVRQGQAPAEPLPAPPGTAALRPADYALAPVPAMPTLPAVQPPLGAAALAAADAAAAAAAAVNAAHTATDTATDTAAPPPPTLADVAALTRDSDYARFVAPGVDVGVKNAALKKLFTDPHFNIMDRLDTYIDDYNTPDPLPAGMLRQMAQAQFLGLFSDAPEVAVVPASSPISPAPPAQPAPAAAAAPDLLATEPEAAPDENADLRLQPHDAAGPAGPEPGAGSDTGRQC